MLFSLKSLKLLHLPFKLSSLCCTKSLKNFISDNINCVECTMYITLKLNPSPVLHTGQSEMFYIFGNGI